MLRRLRPALVLWRLGELREATTETMSVPEKWSQVRAETRQAYFLRLERFLAEERAAYSVFPPEPLVFAALEATPFDSVKVVLLGQDPYHGEGQANGLCFSVQPGVAIPPSLRNIYKEMAEDVGVEMVDHGCLTSWAEQGILMLNSVLTVRANEPNSHRRKGWEQFTDAIIHAINARRDRPTVFVLWGKPAQAKKTAIDRGPHAIVESAHPSPLSANRGFFGSRPFSRINDALRRFGHGEIDWQLPPT